jgi:hypothetical protein
MWTCPKCKIEIEPGFDVCWRCGTSRDGTEDPDFNPESEGIMDEDTYESEVAARRQESLVTLASYLSGAEAHLIRARLEAEGIRVYVNEEQTSDWLMPIGLGGIKLEVPERDVERARELLDSLSRQVPDESSPGDDK